MKKLLHLVTLITVVSSVAITSAPAQGKKSDAKKGDQNQSQSQAGGKITKADAERLVLQRNPGANVLTSTEATVNGHKVWAVSFSTTGAPAGRKVYVDEETGKFSY